MDNMFTLKYINLFGLFDANVMKNGLGRINSFFVVHWRRHDQVMRCKGKRDDSLNCDSVSNFIAYVKKMVSHYKSENRTVYVSTNEKRSKTLRELSDAGLLLSNSQLIRNSLPGTLNIFETFILEYMIMCHARYFIAFGASSIHCYVKLCRNRYADLPFVTVFDDHERITTSRSSDYPPCSLKLFEK